MAGSGSYARGDQPRSVRDDLKAAEDAAARKQRDYNARQEEAWYRKHPGTAESLIPVWGSGREAVADAFEGDVVGAVANGALAVADLTGEGYVLKTLGKGGLKIAGSNGWKATRKWMGDKELLEAGQHGHHWLAHRNSGWGKAVPDIIKNQPWNIKAMPSAEVHARMRGARNGQPKFNAIERYIYGTPAWWKVQNGVTVAHGANGAQEVLNPAARNNRSTK